jgi:hypothetical protein
MHMLLILLTLRLRRPHEISRLFSVAYAFAGNGCIFHVIKEVHTLILDGGRAIKNRLKRQSHTGRQKRRGRPSKTAQKQRQGRQGMRKKEQAPLVD